MASEIHEQFVADLEREIDPVYFEGAFDLRSCESSALPAALCASSYAAHCWAFDVASGVVDPVGWIGEEQFEADRDALARGLMVANRCRPLSAQELGVSQDPSVAGDEAFGGSFIRGVFRRGDLCQALVAEAWNGQGEKELHLCIRGTDMENNTSKALSAFQTLVGYFLWTYPRIEKHAENFVELAQAAAARASDPANGISRLVISGHSLGGAAAQSLVGRLTECSAPVRVVTFGSPGTGSGWLAPLDKMIKSIRKSLSSGFEALARASEPTPSNANSPLGAFSRLSRSLSKHLARPLPLSGPAEQMHFRHPNDPIPKLGSLLYKVGSAPMEAMDPREFDLKQEGQGLLASGIGAHSCSRYFRSIQGMLAKYHEEVEPWREASFEMKSWASASAQSLRLEMSVDAKKAAEAIAAARSANGKLLESINPLDPAISRIKALPEPAALAEKIASKRRLRKIQAALSGNSVFSLGLEASKDSSALWNSKPGM